MKNRIFLALLLTGYVAGAWGQFNTGDMPPPAHTGVSSEDMPPVSVSGVTVPGFTQNEKNQARYILENALNVDYPGGVAMLINKTSRCKVQVAVKVEKRRYSQVFGNVVIKNIADSMVDAFVLDAVNEVCRNGESHAAKGRVILPVGQFPSGTEVNMPITY